MKKILHLISSPRGAASYSIQLGDAIISKIQATYPGSTVQTTDLVKLRFPHLEESHLNSFFTPADQRTPEHIEAIKHSDEAIRELLDADIIVIGVPFYNYNIHSSLKAWIDHIARAGITFKYDENGPQGLITGKQVYLAVASGGIYTAGPMASLDHAVPYMKTILGFLGMTDVKVFRAEGTSMPGIQDSALQKAVESIVL